ncbi:MAG TPA: endonuclease NucS domain-containing protein [Leptolyngbyaceae cyanobacterium]
MLNVINLKQTGSGWQFEGEEALEDFVWANLPQLFGLIPLKRQYIIDEQRCDILALAESNQLVVVELKNVEDRYVVQQLTRYYHALQEEKPFGEQVDYEQPIRLIAVTPGFHRDNFTDRKYSHLNVEFLQFGILVDGEKFYLQLKDVDSEEIRRLEIPYQERESNENIPPPPKALQKLLNKCDPLQKKGIMKIRQKILSFDKRIEEISSLGAVKYGNVNGKTNKLCAEICVDSKGNIILFLWLPLKNLTGEKVGRARIWTDWGDLALLEGYVSTGIGAKVTSHKKSMANFIEKMQQVSKSDVMVCLHAHGYIELDLPKVFAMPMNYKLIYNYLGHIDKIRRNINKSLPVKWEDIKLLELFDGLKYETARSPYYSLEYLLDLALKKWISRIK